MPDDMAARLRAAYEAINRGDAGPALELMDPDNEWIEPDGAPGVGGLVPGSGVYRSREAVLTGVFQLLAGRLWDDFRVEPEEVIDAGDQLVVLGTLRATVPGSGRHAEAPFAHVWRMRGDRCVWWRCYEDTALLHHARAAWGLGRD
jgi:ketosteroid isomerase-like protein